MIWRRVLTGAGHKWWEEKTCRNHLALFGAQEHKMCYGPWSAGWVSRSIGATNIVLVTLLTMYSSIYKDCCRACSSLLWERRCLCVGFFSCCHNVIFLVVIITYVFYCTPIQSEPTWYDCLAQLTVLRTAPTQLRFCSFDGWQIKY